MTGMTGLNQAVLQWGHALLSVETEVLRQLGVEVTSLQWGHALLSVETSFEIVWDVAQAESFNGATLF